jgi:hypothetical protein
LRWVKLAGAACTRRLAARGHRARIRPEGGSRAAPAQAIVIVDLREELLDPAAALLPAQELARRPAAELQARPVEPVTRLPAIAEDARRELDQMRGVMTVHRRDGTVGSPSWRRFALRQHR